MSQANWYYAVNQERIGPVQLDELVNYVSHKGGPKTFVFGPGFTEWRFAGNVDKVVKAVKSLRQKVLLNVPSAEELFSQDESPETLTYTVHGQESSYVEITLEPNESVFADASSMMYLGQGIKMETVYGDSAKNAADGVSANQLKLGHRLVHDDSLYTTVFTNMSQRKAAVAFNMPFPGTVVPIDLKTFQGELICQKDSLLCGTVGFEIGIAFRKKLGAGFFGDEGLVMQRLTGSGMALLHVGGDLKKIDLEPGEKLRVDRNCLVAMTKNVGFDLEFAGDVKTKFSTSEGLFVATVSGPGQIWLQSLPFKRFAERLLTSSLEGGANADAYLQED